MNIYRLIFIFLIILFLFEDKIKKNKKIYKSLKILVVIIIISMVGLRGLISFDSGNYFSTFKNIPNLFNLTSDYLNKQVMENGYLYLNSLIKTLDFDFWMVFFIVAMISLINISIFIDYFSNYFFYSLAFYYTRWLFLKEFTQIRSGLACSFLYLGFIQLHKNKYRNYVLLILVGSIFHKSVLFGLTFPVFNYFFSKKYLDKLVLISIFILPFINTKIYLNKVLVHILGKNSIYLTGMYSTRNDYIGVYYSFLFLAIILFLNYYFKKYSKLKFLRNLFIYSVFINSSLFYYGDICGRLSSFFNVEFVIQDKFLNIFKNKILIKILMVIFLILLFKVNFMDRSEKIIVPYKTYFEQKSEGINETDLL